MSAQRYKHEVEGFLVEGPDQFIWGVVAVHRRLRRYAPHRYQEVKSHLPRAVFDPDRLQREEAGRAIARSDGLFGTVGLNLRTFTRIYVHEAGHNYQKRRSGDRSEEAANAYARQVCGEIGVQWEPYIRERGQDEAEAEYLRNGSGHVWQDPPLEWALDALERALKEEDFTGFAKREFSGVTISQASVPARTKGAVPERKGVAVMQNQQLPTRQGQGMGMVPMMGGGMMLPSQGMQLQALSSQDVQDFMRNVEWEMASANYQANKYAVLERARFQMFQIFSASAYQWVEFSNVMLDMAAQRGEAFYAQFEDLMVMAHHLYKSSGANLLDTASRQLSDFQRRDPIGNPPKRSWVDRMRGR